MPGFYIAGGNDVVSLNGGEDIGGSGGARMFS